MRFSIYQFKIVYSPIKWVLCLLFVCLIPIATYAPSLIDVLNTFEIYMPLIGVILLSDLPLIESSSRTEELIYLCKRSKAPTILIRLTTLIILIILLELIGVALLALNLSPHGYIFREEPLNFWKLISITLPGILFLGGIALSFSNAFKSSAIGYIVSLSYWSYWMIGANMDKNTPMNLFAFANRQDYRISKVLLLLIFIVLVVYNIYLSNKSPLNRLSLNKFNNFFLKIKNL
ncbi:hypothetical protein KDC22_07065 [Paenibacillus tritici]|jgi:hypothetical protein|uniref:hypothetical protein n=1 Tax=Paenibacillus tritici TaxID=1873425 RepID=UPI001BA5F00A|nr:hypothetical protein [Paenibacillus tritici]QUL56264.1 hypothetical protein KDC22_07065 [Paenibacillus tritici]